MVAGFERELNTDRIGGEWGLVRGLKELVKCGLVRLRAIEGVPLN